MMKLVVFIGFVAFALGDVSHILRSGPEATARILRLDNEVYPDGRYQWAYETENGISAQESGQLSGSGPEAGTAAQGSFSYTSPEGVPVQIQYVADEAGFQPSGSVLPTPPPIPPAIARALEYIRANERSQPTIQPVPYNRRY